MKKSIASQSLLASLLLVAGIVAIIYVLFIFSNSLWQSERKERLFTEFREEIVALEEENKTLSERLAFQRTPQFIDKYAKANLGKVNPGEKVIVLPEEPEEGTLDFSGLTPEEKEKEILKSMPIRRQWWYVFFEQ